MAGCPSPCPYTASQQESGSSGTERGKERTENGAKANLLHSQTLLPWVAVTCKSLKAVFLPLAIQYCHMKRSFVYFFDCAAQFVGSQFPNQESKSGPQQWKHSILTTGPPGKVPRKEVLKQEHHPQAHLHSDTLTSAFFLLGPDCLQTSL